jgi:hypothetical protein
LGTALLTRLTIAAICKIKIEIIEEKKRDRLKITTTTGKRKLHQNPFLMYC